jgi:hypothetical protein
MAAKKKSVGGKKKQKKAGSKKPKAAALIKTHTFRYFCQGHTCAVAPRSKHMSPDDVAVLVANGTNVTITFEATGTPFKLAPNPIFLVDGQPQAYIVDSRHDTFPYMIRCSTCDDQVAIPPEMIVP